jgi:rsbT antagonist protein RsbS
MSETQIPIIALWGALLVPLQGDITDQQAAHLTDNVLGELKQGAYSALVVDLSGIMLVDSHLCSVLAHLATSAQLMGARTILSGIRPEVTLTLLSMDVSLEGPITALSLEQALEQLGVRPGPLAHRRRRGPDALTRLILGGGGPEQDSTGS